MLYICLRGGINKGPYSRKEGTVSVSGVERGKGSVDYATDQWRGG